MTSKYAVGDVHGRADLLGPLLASIKKDAEGLHERPEIVFLGDIVDRGSASRRAMELVGETLADYPGSVLILGNHDVLFRSFLDGTASDAMVDHWLTQLGGYTTLDSYLPDRPGNLDEVRAAIVELVPSHLDLLNAGLDKVIDDHFCFVHAGIRPGVPINEQDPHDLRWIREEFLDHDLPLERIIVHGHTPTESCFPDVFGNRICLDTGAYHSGRLTAARFERDSLQAIFFAEHGGVEVIAPGDLQEVRAARIERG